MKNLVIKNHDTIRKKVYKHVREQLLSGEIKPGERLVEARIAADIGVSRTPVREALHSLELEGIIESIPRVGYTVSPTSIDEISEICEIRVYLEGLAAKWAMERSRDKLVSQLEKNIVESEEHAARGNVRLFVEHDARFHEIIANMSGSKRLLELTQLLRRHMLRYYMNSKPDNVFRAIEGHKAIFEGFKRGDIVAVNDAMRRHLEQSRNDIVHFALKQHEVRTTSVIPDVEKTL
jgi:GntR family transcriptional regulator, rspAB operon transcriptional repressor